LGGYLNNLIVAPATFARTQDAEGVSVLRRQAVSMAVLAKLHIAYEQYRAAAEEYRRSAEVADVDQRLFQQIANRAQSDVESDLERISAQVSAVFSALERDQSYAEAQAALGRLYATLGIDPDPDQTDMLDIGKLDRAVRRVVEEERQIPPPDAPANATQGQAPNVPPAPSPAASADLTAPADPQGEPADRAAARESLAAADIPATSTPR
jgi:hypothetical protein